MRIEGLRSSEVAGRPRVSATIIWEDAARTPAQLYLETGPALAEVLSPSPDAFLLAATPLALLYGERRILVDGTLCERLHEGLAIVLRELRTWSRRWRAPHLEASGGLVARQPSVPRRAACFMSGGVDALALLRDNRLRLAPDEPGAIRDGLLIFGLNTYDFTRNGEPVAERVRNFEAHAARLESFGRTAGLTLISIRTNIRALYPDFQTWGDVGWSMGTVSAALALTERLTDVWLADAGPEPLPSLRRRQLQLLEHYSTGALRAHLGQPGVTRLSKVRLLTGWQPALDVLRPCVQDRLPPEGLVNCGRCGKCMRTMLELLAAGALHRCPTFPFDDLTPGMLSALATRPDPDLAGHLVAAYEELVPALREIGRDDLLPCLERALAEARQIAGLGALGWLRRVARRSQRRGSPRPQ